jgi:DNA polymerase I-like protein with 3'-5' exonuclease and polymerase domains
VFENFSKPANYSFLKEVNLLLTKISGQKLIIDRSKLNQRFMKKTDFVAVQKFLNSSDKISYNIFKSKTGRLSTQKNSFPILAFDKRFRQILKPHNHWFLELDFNANELRVLQALNGVEQPKEDIHEWNIKNVFRGLGTRAEAKKRAFAWLYNPNSEDHLMSRFYNKDKILSTYYKDGIITTPFDRKIPSDDFHALNYLIQSTASDVCLTQAIKLDKLLNNRKSYITAVHDSVLIDYNEEDRDLLKDLVETYGNTSLGEFKVNIAAGVNYGEMKELCR